ncbi:acVLRF1 family peptidyl-tRNA hydrolase [Nocardioides nanhaiensis]|uniref:Actinobacteria/chloroflexi VLRF1 release factor domain-containing protein n=1 Tax=Nocardioides nanhaiensis TaxID=1476871 RepID=A0ABP8WNB8_9ACTN
MTSATQVVLVPRERIARWVENFEARHGATRARVDQGALVVEADDGSHARLRLPFDAGHDGPADVEAFRAAARVPDDWGVLLVRKGGFAVARLSGEQVVESKVGQRHVQGRTKAGGQSQQRFARRRDNQARDAYRAAADHAARLLGPGPLVVGGDQEALSAVLADPRLTGLQPVGQTLAVPDPRRAVLLGAVRDAVSVRVEVVNA